MITLDRLVNVLSGHGVRLCWSSVSRSTELNTVVMHEASTDHPIVGDVLLAIDAASLGEAVQWAASAHAVAVVMRGADVPRTFDSLAGVGAVLTVDQGMSWSELAAVVYGLVLEGRETESGRGPTDLFALADSLSDTVDGAVVIHDKRMQVLAYSKLQQHTDRARAETILSRQMPKELCALFQARGAFAHLGVSDDPVFVDESAEHGVRGRMVVAVRSHRELMGSVWVECSTPLDQPARAALIDGAHKVALHLLRSHASADLERQIESELVIRLLEGTDEPTAVVRRLGLPPGPLRVIALQAFTGSDHDTPLLVAFERATTGFGWSRAGRSALAGSTIYTLLPGEQATAARRWVTALRAALPEPVTVFAGISAPARVTELAIARREADECLAMHGADPSSAPAAYDEAWADLILQRLRTAARSGRVPMVGPVAELRRNDRDNGTDYVSTLQAWLEAQGDPARAGKRLGVHENTVRYRLRKMAEITDLPLDNAKKRFAMMIALAATASA